MWLVLFTRTMQIQILCRAEPGAIKQKPQSTPRLVTICLGPSDNWEFFKKDSSVDQGWLSAINIDSGGPQIGWGGVEPQVVIRMEQVEISKPMWVQI